MSIKNIKNDTKKKLVNSGFWALFGKIVGIASNLVVYMILTRSIKVTEFGAYLLAYNLVTMGTVLGALGLDQSIIPLLSRAESFRNTEPKNANLIINRILLFNLLGGLLISCLFYFFRVFILEDQFKFSLLLEYSTNITLWIFLSSLQCVLAQIFTALNYIKLANIFGGIRSNGAILGNIIFLFGLCYLYLENLVSLLNLFRLTSLCSFISLFIGLLFLLKVSSLKTSKINTEYNLPNDDFEDEDFNTSLNVSIIKTSYPLLILAILATLRSQIDTWLIASYGSQSELALYSSSSRIAILFASPQLIVNSFLSPNLSGLYFKNQYSKIEKLLRTSSTLLGVFSIFIFLPLAIFGRDILGLIYGSIYKEGLNILLILSVGQIFSICIGSSGMLLVVSGHQRLIMVGTALVTIITFILGIPVAKYWGLLGVSILISCSLIIQNIVYEYLVYREVGIKTHFNVSLMIFFHDVLDDMKYIVFSRIRK